MQNIVILFGEMGSGKNYHGEKIAKEYGYTFFDGDTVVPSEMLEKVSKFEPLTREMVKDYVSNLASEIIVEAKTSNGLVVAQALYFDEDRKFLNTLLTAHGYKVEFRWVRTPFWRNLKQIYSRNNGLRWVIYWLTNKPFFQKPTHKYNEVQ